MSRNDYHTTRSNYKFIVIDLSRQTNTSILQQNNLIGKLEEGDCVIMLFIAKKQQKITLK